MVIEHAHRWLSNALISIDGPVLLTSPYLTYAACQQIADAVCGGRYQCVLVTSLDPSAVAHGYLSTTGLKLLLAAEVEVHHVERLHAKCFIIGSRAMTGSANLTGAGLGSSDAPNREIGVELTPDQADAARRLIGSWPARVVTAVDLDELLDQASHLTAPESADSGTPGSVRHLQQAERLLADARTPGRSLWMKVEYGEPDLEGWRRASWFASPKKGRPSFHVGDLVLICAQKTKECYAVVQVTSEPQFQPSDCLAILDQDDADRWPWITRTAPRLVPDELVHLARAELGVSPHGLQNGHVRLKLDQFTAAVRSLARLAAA